MAYVKMLSQIYLEVVKKITKILIHDSRSQGRNSNPGPPEYEAAMLNSHALFSVFCSLS